MVALAILQEADELIFDPVSSDMDQLDLLAEALADRLAAWPPRRSPGRAAGGLTDPQGSQRTRNAPASVSCGKNAPESWPLA